MTLADRSWRAVLLATAVASGIAFVLLALGVAGGPLGMDLTLNDGLRPLRFGLTGTVIDAVNLLGEPLVWDLLVLVVALVLWLRGRRFEAVVLVVGVIGAEAGASVAKIVIGRVRPPGIVVSDLITQASFPSGHVTRAVVTCGLLAAMAWNRPRWRLAVVAAALAFIVVMGVARIAVGEHWFTDVVGAAFYGLFALALIGLVAGALRPELEGRLGRPRSGRASTPELGPWRSGAPRRGRGAPCPVLVGPSRLLHGRLAHQVPAAHAHGVLAEVACPQEERHVARLRLDGEALEHPTSGLADRFALCSGRIDADLLGFLAQ